MIMVYIAPLKDVQLVSDSNENGKEIINKTLFYTSPLLITLVLVIWLPFYIALLAGCLLSFLIRTKTANFGKMLRTKQGLNMVHKHPGLCYLLHIAAPSLSGFNKRIFLRLNQGSLPGI